MKIISIVLDPFTWLTGNSSSVLLVSRIYRMVAFKWNFLLFRVFFLLLFFFWWRLHFPLSHIKKLRISPKHNKLDRVYWFNFAPQRLAVRSGTNGPTHYHLYANAFSHFHSNRCFSFSAKETFGHFVGIMPSGTLQEVEFWYRQEFLSVLLGFIPLIL